MAGSPRYIQLLADVAIRAEPLAENLSTDELWTDFDLNWESLKRDPDHPLMLISMSVTGLALLSRLTGTPVPRLAAEATELHIDKNAGYAGADNPDPWANFREAVSFGTTPFAGAMIRLGDKHIRTVNLRRNPDNERVGEAITETIRDAVAYPLIAYCLLEEQEVAA
jgi:hypothetical protein